MINNYYQYEYRHTFSLKFKNSKFCNFKCSGANNKKQSKPLKSLGPLKQKKNKIIKILFFYSIFI